jgi:hypothetical protein
MKKPISLVEVDGAKRLALSNDLSSHLSTHAYLYLQEHGWFNDFPCDEEGITPWMTFPAIAFLKDILSKETKVFEYGCGYSTIFFNNNVGETVSVEHDIGWVERVKSTVPDANIHVVDQNAKVHDDAEILVNEFIQNFVQTCSDDRDHDVRHGLINNEFAGYASTIFNYPKGYFDVIVVDGMARALSGVLAVERARDDTLIILDNSDRWQYNNLQQYLIDKGYKRIDFWGPGWNNYHAWCTSIFCKDFNFKNNRLHRPETEGPILT